MISTNPTPRMSFVSPELPSVSMDIRSQVLSPGVTKLLAKICNHYTGDYLIGYNPKTGGFTWKTPDKESHYSKALSYGLSPEVLDYICPSNTQKEVSSAEANSNETALFAKANSNETLPYSGLKAIDLVMYCCELGNQWSFVSALTSYMTLTADQIVGLITKSTEQQFPMTIQREILKKYSAILNQDNIISIALFNLALDDEPSDLYAMEVIKICNGADNSSQIIEIITKLLQNKKACSTNCAENFVKMLLRDFGGKLTPDQITTIKANLSRHWSPLGVEVAMSGLQKCFNILDIKDKVPKLFRDIHQNKQLQSYLIDDNLTPAVRATIEGELIDGGCDIKTAYGIEIGLEEGFSIAIIAEFLKRKEHYLPRPSHNPSITSKNMERVIKQSEEKMAYARATTCSKRVDTFRYENVHDAILQIKSLLNTFGDKATPDQVFAIISEIIDSEHRHPLFSYFDDILSLVLEKCAYKLNLDQIFTLLNKPYQKNYGLPSLRVLVRFSSMIPREERDKFADKFFPRVAENCSYVAKELLSKLDLSPEKMHELMQKTTFSEPNPG